MRGLLIDNKNGEFSRTIEELQLRDILDGQVLVDVSHSSLNYKDALAITNSAPVVRNWPMVPGIDGAGVVEESRHPSYAPGDRVIVNGWGVGEIHWGCLAERAILHGDWLLPMPDGMDAWQAMAIGTAGYTAMLCAMAIEAHGGAPGHGDVLVTGAGGGVGSFAISILSQQGFRVVASSGRPEIASYLRDLGAAEVVDRTQFAQPGKSLQRERWGAAVDVVGGVTLANVCASIRYGGVVAACGMAQSMDLPVTVAPFILRGVTLAGIDSVMAPKARRQEAWARLARVDLSVLQAICREISLGEVIENVEKILAGSVRGRIVVSLAGAPSTRGSGNS